MSATHWKFITPTVYITDIRFTKMATCGELRVPQDSRRPEIISKL